MLDSGLAKPLREIRGWTAATPMPHTLGYVLGIINLRGAVMPVIDLRCRLGLGITEASSRHVIVVIQHGAQLAVGWRVEIEIALLRHKQALG